MDIRCVRLIKDILSRYLENNNIYFYEYGYSKIAIIIGCDRFTDMDFAKRQEEVWSLLREELTNGYGLPELLTNISHIIVLTSDEYMDNNFITKLNLMKLNLETADRGLILGVENDET